MKNINSILAVGAVAALCGLSSAGVVASGSYTFSSNQSGTGTPTPGPIAYNGSAIQGLAPGSVERSAPQGFDYSASNNNFRALGWGTGATSGSNVFTGSIDLDRYFTFTLTADSGYTFDLNSITFGVGRSGTGPRSWQWRSSVDSYASALTNYTSVASGLTNSSGVLTNPDTNSSWTGNVLTFSGSSFSGMTSVTLRLYGYNSESTLGTGGLQGPLSFSVTMNAVPAPGAAALIGLAGLVTSRRRK